jgi:hypothetical protein
LLPIVTLLGQCSEGIERVLIRIRTLPPSSPFWPSRSGRQAAGSCEIACEKMRSKQVEAIPGCIGGSDYKRSLRYTKPAGLRTPRGPHPGRWGNPSRWGKTNGGRCGSWQA